MARPRSRFPRESTLVMVLYSIGLCALILALILAVRMLFIAKGLPALAFFGSLLGFAAILFFYAKNTGLNQRRLVLQYYVLRDRQQQEKAKQDP
ncbi:hypothetical protein [Desulfohalobium retbaense]|uniref:Uncharacterized protein n=1 Tax=Desulfohalobium retbaense (strain ATCC 49708 / DSM 5692 / JCM 16813 / HR100) TaxID=485915 RepID=C8X0P4_DESRD|nr:hypothetical protein [Desulfohalobium retbaense]ACV67991.1 hypothetical protein Dret_0699 [Desulfohalobium retbaense DSM 5692]